MADALESLLRPVATVLNRNIAASTPARELCDKLDGRSVAIRVRDTGLAMYFCFEAGAARLTSDYRDDPDVAITGSLLTLARLALAADEGLAEIDGIDLTGDARTATTFQNLLGFAQPDIEEELSVYVGDVAAHQLGQAARGFRSWLRDAATTMQGNLREYLQEESREVPSRYEVERFASAVGDLRDDVARLEARLKRLEAER